MTAYRVSRDGTLRVLDASVPTHQTAACWVAITPDGRGRTRLQELEPILEEGLAGQAFLAGERPAIADLSLASSVFQLGFASIVRAGEHTRRWFDRVSAIDGFRRSLPQR